MTNVKAKTRAFVKATRAARFRLPELEREFRYQVVAGRLEQFKGNQCRTAKDLGIHRNTLARIIEEMQKGGHKVTAQRKPRRKPAATVLMNRAIGPLLDCDDEPIPGCCDQVPA